MRLVGNRGNLWHVRYLAAKFASGKGRVLARRLYLKLQKVERPLSGVIHRVPVKSESTERERFDDSCKIRLAQTNHLMDHRAPRKGRCSDSVPLRRPTFVGD